MRTGSACLVVEREVLVGMDLEDGLREAGFDVRWVASAEGALAVLGTARPDIAIVDGVLGTAHGIRLAGELKRCNIPFIVHSGLEPTAGAARSVDAPWFMKPADIGALVSTATGMMSPTAVDPAE